MTQDPGEAREAMEIYSPVFKVDGQACYLPQVMAPPPPPPRQRQVGQMVLYLLLVVTLCGVIVEACFMYKLYNTTATADTLTTEKRQQDERDATANSYRTEVKPPKPSAHLTASTHLPREDGLMMWTTVGGDAFTHEMDYTEGKLFVKTKGYYFIYSKVFFSEPSPAAFTHTILRISPHSPNKEMELMRTFRFHERGDRRGGMLNSYLGGVYILHEGDAIFVKVHNHTKLLRQTSADNFFGTFML
ncbi:tumor necrosis factor ligand superfamily member 14-like isoform X1 [Paramormyrops kingsleyae]|uniref:TNF superfamily member 14 n=2 Tax=Paramormyrops kingsleyae TaxID=1676925 RepID=A0A3B3SVF4_9TELE|nr:tumor necrosis factor ligand superfamily member 14-like [Paramormyrops kingsleyae]XP_023677719.1 tumor necrosis factor ligand superfamily member 14-like [Paramormyrops kingsleyae]